MQLERIHFQDFLFSGRINEVARTLGMPSFISIVPSKPIAPYIYYNYRHFLKNVKVSDWVISCFFNGLLYLGDCAACSERSEESRSSQWQISISKKWRGVRAELVTWFIRQCSINPALFAKGLDKSSNHIFVFFCRVNSAFTCLMVIQKWNTNYLKQHQNFLRNQMFWN